MDNRGNSTANTCVKTRLRKGVFISYKPTQASAWSCVIHNNRTDRMVYAGDISFKFLPYQLWMVGYWPTMAITGNGELGFDSGEGA
jgi:hypothetical protein